MLADKDEETNLDTGEKFTDKEVLVPVNVLEQTILAEVDEENKFDDVTYEVNDTDKEENVNNIVSTDPTIIVEEESDKESIADDLDDKNQHSSEFLITDPTTWKHSNITSERIHEILIHVRKQDIDKLDFTNSKVSFRSQNRFASKTIFYKKLLNGECKKREWMFYSEERGKIFCVACKLFDDSIGKSFSGDGFNNWKHTERIKEHENSDQHRKSINLWAREN